MTVLEKNQKLLRESAAITGRTLKEDGTVVNLADLAERVAAAVNDDELVTSLLHGTNANGVAEAIGSTGDALWGLEQGHYPGGRNEISIITDYVIHRKESNLTVLSQTGAFTVGAGGTDDTHLIGITFLVALTGTCVVTGFQDGAATPAAQSFTFPATTAAGFYDFFGARNLAGPLTVTCSNAGDDNDVLIHWRPQ